MKNNRKINLIITWQLILSCLFLLGWSYTLKTNTPAGTDDPTEADDRMREIKAALIERLDIDHYFTASATSTYDASDTGKHEVITLLDMDEPTQVSGYAHLWMDSDELYYMDDTNSALQLTDSGTLNITSSDLLGTLENNTYFTAVDNAGTGTVNLIKADANDVAVLPDNSQTATNAAPTSSTGLANKKYVDDNVGSANWTPTSYAGGESVTCPNGVIIKFGLTSSVNGASTRTVTFGTAFPTAAIYGMCNIVATGATTSGGVIHSLSTSAIVVRNNDGSARDMYWMAVGY